MRLIKSKIAMFSDIHIGCHGASAVWHNISLDFAKWVCKELKAQDIKDIVIPGDVLDDRNEVAVTTLQYLSEFFNIFEDFNIIITVGNHDCYYTRRADIHSLNTLNEWPNITVIDELTNVTIHDKSISFCPWHTDPSDIPKSDIIFGHFDIQSFKMASNKICERGVKSADLLDKADLIVTGHYHLTQLRNYKNGKILYLGSPYEMNWGEVASPKGIYLLDVNTLDFEFIENEVSPKHKKIYLSELIAAGTITPEIQKDFDGNIIKFIVDIDAGATKVDALIKKFYLFKPLELKIEYEYAQQFKLSDKDEFDFQGVNVQNDMVEFIQGLEEVDIKEDVINYLKDIYRRAEVLVT
jgi:DNA repair exonuclease SbcCD nuclease subunit